MAEVLLDNGSQICSMDVTVARNLGIVWDPDIVVHLQSANRSIATTKGLAKNVPFDFGGGVTAYVQLHIVERPAYAVLLGRPFEVTMSVTIDNRPNGDQQITLLDPNTKTRITLPTYKKGHPPPGIKDRLHQDEQAIFRTSMI